MTSLRRLAQAEVVAFLSGWAGAGHRFTTHGAHVFVAGGEAIKIKRAVRYPYLDFSTLELRRRACERELEVNRANAPQLYLGVVAITREADGRLAIGGAGPPSSGRCACVPSTRPTCWGRGLRLASWTRPRRRRWRRPCSPRTRAPPLRRASTRRGG